AASRHAGAGGIARRPVGREPRRRPGMRGRPWLYRNQIQAADESHVLSIVLYLAGGASGIQWRAAGEGVFGPSRSDFHYVAFGLAGCDPAIYLVPPQPPPRGPAALLRRRALPPPAVQLPLLGRLP